MILNLDTFIIYFFFILFMNFKQIQKNFDKCGQQVEELKAEKEDLLDFIAECQLQITIARLDLQKVNGLLQVSEELGY